MELTPEQRAAIAAGTSLANTVASGLSVANPVVGASIAAAAALLNAVMTKGEAMTMDDFNAAVMLDDAAAADELAAQAEATAKRPGLLGAAK